MKLRKTPLTIYFILCLPLQSLISGQYLIKNTGLESYLYKEFYEIRENIFPKDLRINISISRITGTLLYSIDRNMNQLIISLSDPRYPFITIEFNTQKNVVSLSKLCGCDRCEFTNLDFHIQIKDEIRLRCNRGDSVFLQYDQNWELNNYYPLPYPLKDSKTHGANDAQLYLINTPKYKYAKSNPEQCFGCIFNVSYDGSPLEFTEISGNIERGCVKLCTDNLCSGGICHERFGDRPICDCQSTGSNGKYCDDTKDFGWTLTCIHNLLYLRLWYTATYVKLILICLAKDLGYTLICLQNLFTMHESGVRAEFWEMMILMRWRDHGKFYKTILVLLFYILCIALCLLLPCLLVFCLSKRRRQPHRTSGINEPISAASTDETRCAICLHEFNGEVAHLDCCEHEYCATCIMEWLNHTPTCPVDQLEVNYLIIIDKHNGSPIYTIRIRRMVTENQFTLTTPYTIF